MGVSETSGYLRGSFKGLLQGYYRGSFKRVYKASEFPKLRLPDFGVLIIRILLFRVLYIYMDMVPPPPPMYPRLSSQSRLWEGMGF